MEELINKMNQEGFIKNNDYELKEIEDNKVTLIAKVTEKSRNPYGIAHGGFIFGLGDTAMGIASSLNGRKSVTMNANITYLRPVVGDFLKAEATVIRSGKTTCYVKADIYDEKDCLMASMDSNYYYIEIERR